MKPVTERQRRVMEWIEDFAAKNGFAPSVREIGNGLGINSTNGVICHLKALKSKGWIEWNEKKARTIRVVKPVDGVIVVGFGRGL